MAEVTIDALQQPCLACGTIVSVAEVEPLARIACPKCGETFRVAHAFDHFELVETLGVGGMGSVYKARDTRLDRFVALKLLRKELSADPAQAKQLEQEARLTAAVNHPNVVQVYSSGMAHEQIYLVIELVDHGSLDDVMVQEPRVPEGRALATAIQVAKGLQAAHERGLIHRDVKPANILFADAETAKIGDFGLAVLAGHSAEGQNEIWGTPYYVAPERLKNEPEDFRSDIYSLGATLFHALAGQPPMEGESTSAATLLELKSSPPSLRDVAPEVSAETATVVDRMIAPDAANRFGSYAELVDALQRAYRRFSGELDPAVLRRWWVLTLIGALVIAMGATVYVIRERRAAEASIATASKDFEQVAELQRRFGEARQQLISGNYAVAVAAFTKLAADAHDEQPLVNWIQLHLGLAALLQGNAPLAQQSFTEVERAAKFSDAPEDADLVRFFTATGHALVTPAGDPNALGEMHANSPDAFALFLVAMKNWHASEFDAATRLLERYVKSDTTGAFAWVNDYKQLARKFLGDYRVYTDWKKQPQTFTNAAEMNAALTRLRSLIRKLQTHGTLAEAMKAEEKRLNAELRGNKKKEQSETAASSKALERDQPLWEAAIADERKAIATYDFAAALAAIDRVQLTDPTLVEEQAAERKKLRWLAQWKATLIADLSAGRFSQPVTNLRGVKYAGASGANEDTITLRIPPYGSAAVKWTDLAPGALLGMSTSLIGANPAETPDRQWLSAVFALETGQADAARALGEAAAKTKPAYAEPLKLLAP